jgi:hypothetical protein
LLIGLILSFLAIDWNLTNPSFVEKPKKLSTASSRFSSVCFSLSGFFFLSTTWSSCAALSAGAISVSEIFFSKEGNEFTAAAAKAKLAGEDEFEFDGKKYPVEIGQDAAEKILGKKEEVEIEESVELQEAADFGDIER